MTRLLFILSFWFTLTACTPVARDDVSLADAEATARLAVSGVTATAQQLNANATGTQARINQTAAASETTIARTALARETAISRTEIAQAVAIARTQAAEELRITATSNAQSTAIARTGTAESIAIHRADVATQKAIIQTEHENIKWGDMWRDAAGIVIFALALSIAAVIVAFAIYIIRLGEWYTAPNGQVVHRPILGKPTVIIEGKLALPAPEPPKPTPVAPRIINMDNGQYELPIIELTEKERAWAIELLDEAIAYANAHPEWERNRLPGYRELGWSAGSWSRYSAALDGAIEGGTGDGTYVAAHYGGTIDALHQAIRAN